MATVDAVLGSLSSTKLPWAVGFDRVPLMSGNLAGVSLDSGSQSLRIGGEHRAG